MTVHLRPLVLGFLSLALATAAAAAEPQASRDPRADIARKLPGVKPEDLRPSPIPGVYELARGTDIAYISSDGEYAIAGDLYELKSDNNLSEERRRNARVKLLNSVPQEQMISYGPQNPRHTVTVFTDVDCGYCRKLHSQMAQYNKLGIRVQYLFYPRSGPGTASWQTAEQVWCAANRAEALTRAKRGEEVQAKACKTPIARHYQLGQELAVRGTPAIFTADGQMLPGYLPPATLLEHLKR